jgi:hypothetical protein
MSSESKLQTAQSSYIVMMCASLQKQRVPTLEHMAEVEEVLVTMREYQLLVKGSKCKFFCDQMDFLGFVVSADGVSPQMSKVEANSTTGRTKYSWRAAQFLRMHEFFRITHSGIFTSDSMLDGNAERDEREGTEATMESTVTSSF